MRFNVCVVLLGVLCYTHIVQTMQWIVVVVYNAERNATWCADWNQCSRSSIFRIILFVRCCFLFCLSRPFFLLLSLYFLFVFVFGFLFGRSYKTDNNEKFVLHIICSDGARAVHVVSAMVVTMAMGKRHKRYTADTRRIHIATRATRATRWTIYK